MLRESELTRSRIMRLSSGHNMQIQMIITTFDGIHFNARKLFFELRHDLGYGVSSNTLETYLWNTVFEVDLVLKKFFQKLS